MSRYIIVLFASALLGGCVVAPLGYGHRSGHGHGHHIDRQHHDGGGDYGRWRHGDGKRDRDYRDYRR